MTLSWKIGFEIAQLWGLSQPYQAKLKVARYLTNGQAEIVEGALGR